MMPKFRVVLGLLLLVTLSVGCTPSGEVVSTATGAPSAGTVVDPIDEMVMPTELPTSVPPTEPTKFFKVGVVSDVNGFDDHAWNANAWNGLVMARDALGVEIAFLESAQESDYDTHIATFVEQGFDMVITVGASMMDVTQTAAEANPEVVFVIVDATLDPPLTNAVGLTFSSDKSAFLAGFLAAGMTKSGVVATFGAFDFPPVTVYMVGFQNGVEYYNQLHGTSVEVLGMDHFIEGFDSQQDSRQAAEEFIAAGADILLPVVGPAARGAAEAVVDNPGTMFIGVDSDWCIHAEEFCPVTLTSIFNPIDMGVFWAVQQVYEGSFQGGVYNSLAALPLHEFEDDVRPELKAELETVRQGLLDGSIQTGWNPLD